MPTCVKCRKNYVEEPLSMPDMCICKDCEPFETADHEVRAAAYENRSEEQKNTIDRLKNNVRRLLDQVGDKGKCRGCDAEIWWVKLRSGKVGPYTAEGLNHFADCPKADRFRGGK
jgi:hypothetical protein